MTINELRSEARHLAKWLQLAREAEQLDDAERAGNYLENAWSIAAQMTDEIARFSDLKSDDYDLVLEIEDEFSEGEG